MTISNLKIGQQFKSSVVMTDGSIKWFDKVYTIYNITDKRVCYTDGKTSHRGGTNREVAGFWVGIERFKRELLKGKTVFV